mmetsp:Transcript_1425/g.3121  ORF Transcript_1425/g.3121 Transcript_1425/m.3121 type:complete len:114 (-) Transcript_1425:1029-1370(-)
MRQPGIYHVTRRLNTSYGPLQQLESNKRNVTAHIYIHRANMQSSATLCHAMQVPDVPVPSTLSLLLMFAPDQLRGSSVRSAWGAMLRSSSLMLLLCFTSAPRTSASTTSLISE